MSDEDDIQDALADFAEDVGNGQSWTAAILILTEDYELEEGELQPRAVQDFGDLDAYQAQCREALAKGDATFTERLRTDKTFHKAKAPNLARMGPVSEFVVGLLEKGAPEPGADWWPYMPIKRHIDTLFPAPGDVRDMAFWTARTLIRQHEQEGGR
ncbi:hypothetical protein M2333_003000 [Sphingobium sp. B11D3B]|uniref:hypothetical protein n=1 Tax=Sphingobium sp. B11D3B TaxID=2940575 RepID=UPI0022263F4E|nr:hypothetical protein [Sphingobium sp. B11D3B]MCW2389954.1 hypothetical protein [Sphingobium sp. B11D3B]